ncbi:hypothetical protein NQ315_013455 [Exocentrus adspersus]|uniref:DDE-1 domain-containing protein n=1 Tax=Exocentrus adspersus TaxID=1586481 RepID=A0AAV8VDP4_9CUCU|nr:hypothetical protein NQ315_013455 [Exocentrus adspersus]
MFNADESGFNSDPSREQARWTSENVYLGTLYGVSRNGWMEVPHFYHWYVTSFVPHVEALRVKYNLPGKTAILTFDGHCSHASVRIVNAAIEHNIELFLFLSHLTNRIQLLDKSVFGRIKSKWDRILVAHGKSEMGFKTTGVFSVNPDMFSEEYFDPLQLKNTKKSISSLPLGVHCATPVPEEPSPGSSNFLMLQYSSTTQHPNQGTSTSSVEIHVTPLLEQPSLDVTTKTTSTKQVVTKNHSPNSILNIFTQKLQEISSSSRLEGSIETLPKKVVPSLKQYTYLWRSPYNT